VFRNRYAPLPRHKGVTTKGVTTMTSPDQYNL